MGSYDSGSGYSSGSVHPSKDKGYIDSGDVSAKNMRQKKDDFYRTHYPMNAAGWQQGAIDKRFKVGDQTLWSMVYGDNNYYQSRRFFFNLIMRNINMIAGRQRQNRKSTITMPIQNDNDSLSDDYNKVIRWCEDRDGFQEYFSQAFEGALDTGNSLLHMYPDYTLDPISGDLFTDQVAWNNYLIDSNWRKQDLTDCQGIWRRRWVSKAGAKALLPGYAKEIDKMTTDGLKDGRFPLQAELINLNVSGLFAYDEFHYRDFREATIILDPKSGESAEWEEDEAEEEGMLERVLKQQPWLIVKKTQVPTVKLSISLNGKEVYQGANLLNIDLYPFVPMLCYHQPDIQSYAWRSFGVVRNLRDAQYLYNMRKVIEMDLLQSQVQNAWIYPVDVVVDPKCFRQTQNGSVIPLKAGHLPSEIQRLEPQGIPPSVIELSRSLSEDIPRISGVNEELLGAATDDKSGILSMLRQGAGLTTLQTIFDKADYSQRLYGKIRLQAIRKNFSKGKIASILGHEPDERFFTSHSQKYGIAVEEGNYAASQRQLELQQLLYFKELGMPIADKSILNAAFITNKKQVIEDMQQQTEQQQQAQQQEAQKAAQVDESKIIQAKAKASLDMASAQEKLAGIDKVQAQAEHEKSKADLDLLKMMLELENMDLEQIKNTFELAESIKMANEERQLKTALGG